MSTDTNHLFARITPVDSAYTNRVLNSWSQIRRYVASQFLGFLYGIGCASLPMLAACFVGWIIGAPPALFLTVGMMLTFVGGAAAMFGMYMYGFPMLVLERRACSKLLKTVELGAEPVISPFDPMTRVVELVPRERWRKRFCLDTATDLMMIRVDQRGVWMKGDRYRYELPAESILGAQCERYRPRSCSFLLFVVIIYVRTEEGTIELPISYRDYGWREFRQTLRHAQTIDLVEHINAIAKGYLVGLPMQPATVAEDQRHVALSQRDNPYAAPALINE
jgi:hypothetical protein